MKNLVPLFFTISFGLFGQETSLTFENNKESQLKGDEKHLYEVPLNSGELLQLHLLQKNVDLQIIAFSPDNDTLQQFDAGYFGVMVPRISVKWCHLERCCNYS